MVSSRWCVSSVTPEFIRGLHNVRPHHRGCVATIGTFDGVHLGHQAILQQLATLARTHNLPVVVVIFEPQPHEYFAKECAPARLMRLREKVTALFAQGVDKVLCLRFNRKLSKLSAQDFIQKVLVEGLAARHLVIGDDFRFGCDRKGDYALLQQAGSIHNFTVAKTCTFVIDHVRVSSTRIRKLLEAGDFGTVERLLGRPYTLAGRVVQGKQLGRTLGVPTANILLHRCRSPLAGVFVITVQHKHNQYQGVANVGVRPTVSGDLTPLLEVHLFDFSGDIYTQKIEIYFHKKLRSECKFASIDALKKQLQIDIKQAQAYFLNA